MKKALLVVIFLALVAAAFYIGQSYTPSPNAPATTTPSSNTPTNTEPKPFSSDKVKITSPLPGATVPKIFAVKGEARGQWYFEASFPVQVRDKDNNKIGQGIAQAQGEWMTEQFVPFTADVSVEGGYAGPAMLVLLKDNPSGLPENDDSVSIPIVIQ